MSRSVEIRTGARLHFGLFATLSPGLRQGGIGMMIDRPGWRLRATPVREDVVVGDSQAAERVKTYLAQLRDVGTIVDPVRIEVLETIPPHRGLGSGTQLALALWRLLKEISLIAEPANLDSLRRGERSLVGSIGFDQGGFIVDPGSRSPLSFTQPRVVRVPENWRVVIVEPLATETCSGAIEEQAFAGLEPMGEATRARLARLVEGDILPGLEQNDFHNFAAGIATFNRIVGEQFAPAQGGIYAHRLIRELAERLEDSEWPYLAQSSWGPVGAIFCESDESAERLEGYLRAILGEQTVRLWRAWRCRSGFSA